MKCCEHSEAKSGWLYVEDWMIYLKQSNPPNLIKPVSIGQWTTRNNNFVFRIIDGSNSRTKKSIHQIYLIVNILLHGFPCGTNSSSAMAVAQSYENYCIRSA